MTTYCFEIATFSFPTFNYPTTESLSPQDVSVVESPYSRAPKWIILLSLNHLWWGSVFWSRVHATVMRQSSDTPPLYTRGVSHESHENGSCDRVFIWHMGVVYIYCLFSYIYIHTTLPMCMPHPIVRCVRWLRWINLPTSRTHDRLKMRHINHRSFRINNL